MKKFEIERIEKTRVNPGGKIIYFIVPVLLAFLFTMGITCNSALGAPTITGVTGTISDGQSISIRGNGFGANGPTVVLFDDFEGGTNGQQMAANLAKIGTWNTIQQAPYVTYSNANKISGSLSARFNMNYPDGYGMPVAKFKFASPVTSFFASWWALIPPGTGIPGENGPETGGANWKNVWVMDATSIGEDDPGRGDQTLPTIFATCAYLTANDSVYNKWLCDPPINWSFTKGTWWHFAAWIKGGYSNDGEVKFWTLSSSQGLRQLINQNGVTTLNPGRVRWYLNMNGFARRDYNAYPTFDDMYVATGEYAQARVEIGNSPTYMSSTKLALVTMNSWNDSLIAGIVRQGSFQAGDQAYLFVTDAAGNVNSGGYPITISATISTGPSNPKNLQLIGN